MVFGDVGGRQTGRRGWVMRKKGSEAGSPVVGRRLVCVEESLVLLGYGLTLGGGRTWCEGKSITCCHCEEGGGDP